MIELIEYFREFQSQWHLQKCQKHEFPDDTDLIPEKDGKIEMTIPPQNHVVWDSPPTKRFEKEETKYLWVINGSSVPLVLEHCERGKTLGKKRACHANLTGGEDAYCGGEIWFQSSKEIYINGGSGRYPVKCIEQLEQVTQSFCNAGFNAFHMGWDENAGEPQRYYRGNKL